MSLDATRWAWQQTTGSSTRKTVLLSMADRCGENHTCYPSIGRLAADTELDVKTVRKVIKELCELGLIEWTGEVSKNGTRVYRLIGVIDRHSKEIINKKEQNIGKDGAQEPQNTPTNFGSTLPKTVVPKTEVPPYQKREYPPTNFGSTPLPKTVAEPTIEPINEPTNEPTGASAPKNSNAEQRFEILGASYSVSEIKWEFKQAGVAIDFEHLNNERFAQELHLAKLHYDGKGVYIGNKSERFSKILGWFLRRRNEWTQFYSAPPAQQVSTDTEYIPVTIGSSPFDSWLKD